MNDNFDVFNQGWIWLLSSLAGIVSYVEELLLCINQNQWPPLRVHIVIFTGRLITACFCGIVGYALAEAAGVTMAWEFVIVAMTAWRGSKGLPGIWEIILKKIDAVRLAISKE